MSACAIGDSRCHNDGKIGCDNKDDSPAESFFLSKAAELDWIDRNAFIDRKGSSVNLINSDFQIPNNQPASDSAGSPIISPPKPHNKSSKRRRRSIRLFPKRSSEPSVVEPSSPKVSCTGRVRSRSRRGKKKQAEAAITRSRSQKRRGFCWSSFRCIFRRQQSKGKVADPPTLGAVKRFSSARRSDAWAADAEESERPPPTSLPLGRVDVLKSDPPSLGVMPRFSSARRSDAWVADLQGDGADP